MVLISINPKKGNHTRYFPHSGYLGLSPVVVSGSVSTHLQEDRLPIEASKLVVRIRCYEALGSSHSVGTRPDQPLLSSNTSTVNVLWQTEKTVWIPSSATANQGYDFLGDSHHPWRLTVPTHAVESVKGGHAAVGSITYKTWRAWWLLEAVVYHKSMGMSGNKIIKSHSLFLPNYSRSPSTRLTSQLHSATSTSPLSYSITAPASLSCGDDARLSFTFATPPQPPTEALIIKRVSVSLVRTLVTHLDPPPLDPPEPKRWKLRRLTLPPSARPYPSRQTSTIDHTILETDVVSGTRPVVLNPLSHYRGSCLINVPEPKSRYHYSVGESCQTRLASVSYSFIFKVILKAKSGGLETISLSPLEVKMSSVSTRDLLDALHQLGPLGGTVFNQHPYHSLIRDKDDDDKDRKITLYNRKLAQPIDL